MSTLDRLPGDQRAVLELVLRRARGYDDIERLLSIDRTDVRARALAALDALGPATDVPRARRALIADYLLGQLPQRVSDEVRSRLSEAPGERAWAQAVASELAPIASRPLPEIPGASDHAATTRSSETVPPPGDGAPPRQTGDGAPPRQTGDGAAPEQTGDGAAPERGAAASERPASRLGGAVLLGLGALVAVAVAVFLLTRGGSSHPGQASAQRPRTPTSPGAPIAPSAASTTTSTTDTTPARVVGQVILLPPNRKGTAKGAAGVVARGSTILLEIAATGLAPNRHNAYAVWLYNSPRDDYRVGYYNPGVGTDGRLLAVSALPADAPHYKRLLLALEPEPAPGQPTNIVLEGALNIR